MSSKPVPYLAHLLSPAFLVVLFGFFLHQNKSLALISLIACFLLISNWMRKSSYREIQRVFAFKSCRWFWMVYGAVSAIGLAMLLRWNQSNTLYPWPLNPFLMMAVMVGITEEILFRGYFFGQLHSGQGAATAITISALFHAAYKVAIFIPSARLDDLLFLGSLTFSVGVLLGYWRKASGSIWPCVVFHALFDLWVYGDRSTPWWVW